MVLFASKNRKWSWIGKKNEKLRGHFLQAEPLPASVRRKPSLKWRQATAGEWLCARKVESCHTDANRPLQRMWRNPGRRPPLTDSIGCRCLRVHAAFSFSVSHHKQPAVVFSHLFLCLRSQKRTVTSARWLPQEECWPLWSCAYCAMPSPTQARCQEPFMARFPNHSAKRSSMSPFVPAALLANPSTQQPSCASQSEAYAGPRAPPTTD